MGLSVTDIKEMDERAKTDPLAKAVLYEVYNLRAQRSYDKERIFEYQRRLHDANIARGLAQRVIGRLTMELEGYRQRYRR